MPIYKGSQQINSLYLGNETIDNVYKGTLSVFNNNLLPYRVRISGAGIVNNYETAGVDIGSDLFPYAYFNLDNTSNTGKTWYGIVLNKLAFEYMDGVTNSQYTNRILKDTWYKYISLWIGFDYISTDFSVFTIANTFYALNFDEWDTSSDDPAPKDPSNTHCWKFISDGNYFNVNYVTLDSSDLAAIGMILLLGAEIQEIHLQPFGKEFGHMSDIDYAWLITSGSITFNQTFAPLVFEYLTNNGTRVNSTLVQSSTNNFNFNIYSTWLGLGQEITNLGWEAPTGGNFLHIASYTPPQYNVPGSLVTELINPSEGE